MKLSALLGLACILQVNHAYIQHNKPAAVNMQTITPDIFLQAQPADTAISAALLKLYKHGMPILLADATTVLGKTFSLNKSKNPGDFDGYTWKTKEGLQFTFEDINYNEKGVELDRLTVTAKQVAKHPLGIYLNKSTLAACKKACAGLKKSVDERTYKFSKNKVWYFLEFNKQQVLIKIKSVDWDTDYSG
jgi:hypothetical protein